MSRAWRMVLRLFPAAFRRRYGEELVELLMTQSREARRRDGWYGLGRLWAFQGTDLVRAAWAERRA